MSEKIVGESKSVEGYILMEGEKNYLGKFMGWQNDQSLEDQIHLLVFDDDKSGPEEARVFSMEETDLIVKSLKKDKWKTKPTHVVPAIWSEDGGVVVTGERMSINELPPFKQVK
jgi:hypothetical protein